MFVGKMWGVYCQQKRGMKYMYGVGEEQVIWQDLSTSVFWRETGGGRRWWPCVWQKLALSGPGNVGWLCFGGF